MTKGASAERRQEATVDGAYLQSLHDPGTLRELVTNLREGVYVSNVQGQVLDANPAFLEMLGLSSPEELSRYSAYDLFVDPGQREAELELLSRDGAVREFEFQIRRPDGELRWVLDTCTAVTSPSGEALLHGVLVDITDRKLAESALRESEEHLRAIIANAPIVLWAVDERGVFTLSEGKGLEALGLASGEVVGRSVFEVYADVPQILDKVRRALEGETLSAIVAVHGLVFEATYTPIVASNGMICGVTGVATDITRRQHFEEALRESEERYALAARGANDGLWDWDLLRDEIYYSPRWKAMLGCEEGEVGRWPGDWLDRVHSEDSERVKAQIESHLAGHAPHFESEYRIRHQDGSWRWMLCRGVAVRDPAGKAYRMAGSQTDITERKLAEQQLLHDAFHDALTGLPNRALFADLVARAIGRGKRRDNYLYAVLFLDLDRFKVVNDSLGHMIGDQLLVAIARRLERCVRPGDIVARLGGDEFTILLDDIKDANDATRVADRILNDLAQPFTLSGQEVFTSASIGIALSTTGYERPDALLRDADLAMYRAKALGKTRYEMFDREMHARAMAQLALETDLRRALERQEFRLHYQPIVSLETGRITGFEALLRWQHPQRGLVGPAAFVPVAEETGLIVPIGAWVLHKACHQVRAWQRSLHPSPPLSMSVNLSVKQLLQPDLVEQIRDVLWETELQAQCLRLEITESVIMENAELAIAVLKQLRALNVQLHMDDFGTGYSSLSYLHRFQLDSLKIDRSFVGHMIENEENAEIVRTIVTLGRNLGLQVIAEGVETVEQLSLLRALRCEHVQGFLFSRPVDEVAAFALIAAEQR